MEKSIRKYAFMAAALLAGPIALTSCSSDDEAADVNPTFDGNSVKTQFAINVPHAVGTRMTAANTQSGTGATFLGMNEVRLIPFSTGTNKPTSSSSYNQVINLDNFTSFDAGYESQKIYGNVIIPIGTSHFLFYATAPKGTDATTTTKFQKGSLNATIPSTASSTAASIKFALEDIYTGDLATEGDKVLTALNDIVGTTGWSTQAEGSNLKKLYDDFIKLTAGSTNSVAATLASLYGALEELKTTAENDLATTIQNKISTYVTVVAPAANSTDPYTASFKDSYEFPQNINLPDGAVALKFGTDSKFAFVYNDYTVETGKNVNFSKITYPASLYYCVNTPAATSDEETIDWPKTLSDWTDGFTDWGKSVTASTRAIALKDNINYGVASLITNVTCASSSLADAPVGGVTNNFSIENTTFPVTGVLVGGQPTECGFEFAATTATEYTKTVYDNVNPTNAATTHYAIVTGDATPNYTLLLPTPAATKTVNIAIELENNLGTEFHGVNSQIIPAGGKFYLIGQLVLSNDMTVANVENPAIFMSDYTTTANVKIKSLANAYNTIPDLRATGLELGLSVDLEWKTGLSFDVNIE